MFFRNFLLFATRVAIEILRVSAYLLQPALRTRNIEKPVNKIKDERRFKGQKREKIQLISKKMQEKRRKGVQLNKLTIKTIAEEQKIGLHSDPFWFGHIIK